MQARDQHKLDEFLARQERRAYQMAYYATSSREEALEIVQDSMFKLVQKYSKRPEEEWPPLFTRILQNRIKNWYRRQSIHRALFAWFDKDEAQGNSSEAAQDHGDLGEDDATNGNLATGALRPDRSVQNQNFLDALDAALRELPRRQQQVFLLRAVQGYDVAETASAMECSAGSVKTHYSRALHKLQEKLGAFAI